MTFRPERPTLSGQRKLTIARRIGTSILLFGAFSCLCATMPELAAAQITDEEFVFIKPGTFQMGDARWGPVHTVTLTRGFWMQKTEVTQAQWIAVMGNNPSHFKDCGGACPVESVSYRDVQRFIGEANRQSGKQYRLPTEAEWEYAARAGSTGDFGTPGPVTRGGWMFDNSGGTTHPSGRLAPNAWGLYDMVGNVWEWCSDWYAPYLPGPSSDPAGPASGKTRVLRGGSFNSGANTSTSAVRGDYPADSGGMHDGFRLAMTVRVPAARAPQRNAVRSRMQVPGGGA